MSKINEGFDGDLTERSRNSPHDHENDKVTASKRQHLTTLTKLVTVVGLCLLVALVVLVALIVVVVKDKQDGGDTVCGNENPTKAESTGQNGKQDVCISKDCVETAANVIATINPNVEPCEDFYEFACGRWIQDHVIPEDKSKISQFGTLQDKIDIKLKRLLEAEKKAGDRDYINKAKDMYASCMDTKTIEDKGGQPLKDLLGEVGLKGWPIGNNESIFGKSDLTEMVSQIRLKTATLVFFTFRVGMDERNSSRKVLVMDHAPLGLSKEFFELNGTQVKAYKKLIQETAKLFMDESEDKSKANDVAEQIINFEAELAKLNVAKEKRRDVNATYHPTTYKNFISTYKDVLEWSKYLENFPIPDLTDGDVIINKSPSFFDGIGPLLKKTDISTLANYMGWIIVLIYQELLSEEYRIILQEYQKVMQGQSRPLPRYQTCSYLAMNFLRMPVGQMFVKDNFDHKTKQEVREMIDNLQEAFNQLLDEQDWMDEQTKRFAKEKNYYIDRKIGYPKEMDDDEFIQKVYENYTYTADDYFGNALNARRENVKKAFQQFREPVDTRWDAMPAVVNAHYSLSLNRIMFPAAILQPPFFSSTSTKSLNYGAIGMVIGHEITHGFDDDGRQYDKTGSALQWWSVSAIQKFKDRAQCIVDQYDNFFAEEVNLHVNGINTQDENIADNGGLKESFKAYRNWVKSQGKEEPLLPGLNYTHNQLFFVGFAQVWCGQMRDAMLRSLITMNEHAPARFRVLGTLQNSEDFSKAFQCKLGTYMNPARKCSVW